jgi:membrane-bound lytic murein transglycosylase D
MLLNLNKKTTLISSIFIALLSINGCAINAPTSKATPPEVSVTDTIDKSHKKVAAVVEPEPVKYVINYTPADECIRPYDIWDRIRDRFSLDHPMNKRIERELNWYKKHPKYIKRVVDRARPYLHLMVKEAELREFPAEIVLLPIVESAFQPFAYSHGRAAGLWQFIPGTGRRFGLKMSWWYDGRRDVAESTRAAYDYFDYLTRLFDDNWMHALASYNSGEGTVRRAIKKNRKKGKKTDYWSLDLPRETEGYVPKLLAIAAIIDEPHKYGIELDPVENKPFLTTVDVGSQIDMDLAAELAELSLEEIYLYNPAFNRWATDPKGPHKLLVPIEKAEVFTKNLAHYPENERIKWKRYRVKSGEVLGTIAEKHHTSVSLIKQVNRIRGNTIRVGQKLIIPVARKKLYRYSMSSSQRLSKIKNTKRSGERIDYLVAEGDTLWGISQQFKVSVAQIASWNGMAPRDTLRPGSKLVIWKKQAKGSTTAKNVKVSLNPATFKHPYEKNTNRKIGYTVRQGDSLALISQKFGVTVSKLKRWNSSKLKGQKYIQPGDFLVVYVDVKRQSGQI